MMQAKLQARMQDCQKDASVQSEERRRTLQGHAVQWDRFLPFRSIRVLLVENNDSTRLLITALLRNCGYEVVAVRNGKEAWKIIEDQTNDINLVLTEVVTPSLPGVHLLSKIGKHKISKHIPVIMMSSNDCTSTVIKCLSKGAVDFLVKPIRKNELKNLWQHVWRKCGGARRPEAFSREDEFADVIPDDPSENHVTEDRSEPILKRQRIEADLSFRRSNFSAFTRYSTSTNSRALVGNKEEDDMRSTNNNIFSEREAEHYNHTHNSSEAAEEHHHYYHHHHHHLHVHNNHRELLTGSANEQNYTTYSFSGSGSGNNSNSATGGSGGPHQKFQVTQREIALNRFREKRKKRCFDNKV